MKVAYDAQIFTLQAYGGISRYFVKLLNELHSRDIDAKVCAGYYQNKYLGELPEQLVQGVGLKKYPPKTGRIFKAINHFICNRAVERYSPDIFHETYFSPYGSPHSAGAARFVTVYDMIHEKFPDSFPVRDDTAPSKLAAVKRADHVICISQSTKNDLCEIYDVDPGKVSVVYLGFDEIASQPVKRRTCDEKPYFLYVGQRKGYKNFSLLLKAVASKNALAKNVDVVAFGGGAFNVEEQNLIQSLGFGAWQVRQLVGDDQLLAETYAQALGFVYPSVYEGFGLPPLEAMAYRCPVISSNTSSLPEVVGDAGLYFNPHSVEDLAVQLTKILEGGSLRDDLINLGLKRKEMFTWSKCADETLLLYKHHSKAGSRL